MPVTNAVAGVAPVTMRGGSVVPQALFRCVELEDASSSKQTVGLITGLNGYAMRNVVIALVILAGAGCSDRSPIAPTVPRVTQPPSEPAAELATIRGQVYADVTWGNPPIEDAVIEVVEADGAIKTAFTDEDGFYTISARPGDVSITAAKEGYEAKTWELSLSKDTVLNFGLVPR